MSIPNKGESMKRYYLLHRPAMPGTVPTKKGMKICNFDFRKYVQEIKREAWGFVEYLKPLTKEEIKEYELMEA